MVQDIVCIVYGALKLCVDASLGGHVVEFSLEGKNALATNRSAIGSTFWPSPQASWGWPPLAALDNQPYSVVTTPQELLLKSEICPTTGLQLEKKFWFEAGHLEVSYTMVNTTEASVKYAPWEITRILGGITFYKSEQKPLAISTGSTVEQAGVVWHSYEPKQQKINEKIFGNGSSGWLANAYDGLLLAKRFDRVADEHVAPGEAEVEIYAHADPSNAYIEMEQQGAYKTIEAKKSYQWQVGWYLQKLPNDVQLQAKNQALPKIVEKLLSHSI